MQSASLADHTAAKSQGAALFTNLTVIPCGDQPVQTHTSLLVENGRILAVGPDADQQAKGALTIDASGHTAIPGLINGHTHLALAFLRGRGHAYAGASADASMVEDLFFKTEPNLTPELVEPLCYSYLYDGLLAGVTCFADHYYFCAATGRAIDHLGLRGCIGETVADLGGSFPSETIWAQAKKEIAAWPHSNRITPVVCPHATDTVSEGLLADMAAFARSESLPLHMHLAQTPGEEARTLKRTGLRPVPLAEKCGALTENTLAVHLVSANNDDWQRLADRGVNFGFSPASEMIFASLPDYALAKERGIPFVVATDCAASNDAADVLAEARLTGLLFYSQGTPLSSQELLNMITINPAKALGIDHAVGTLEPGKCADITFIKNDLIAAPLVDPVTNLIYSQGARSVAHVMVDGKWRLWNRALVDLSHARLEEDFAAAAKVTESFLTRA